MNKKNQKKVELRELIRKSLLHVHFKSIEQFLPYFSGESLSQLRSILLWGNIIDKENKPTEYAIDKNLALRNGEGYLRWNAEKVYRFLQWATQTLEQKEKQKRQQRKKETDEQRTHRLALEKRMHCMLNGIPFDPSELERARKGLE